jgi:hypothetical protein
MERNVKKEYDYNFASLQVPPHLWPRLVAETDRCGLSKSKVLCYALEYFFDKGGVLNFIQYKHKEKK